jgi:hypothetical protein
MYYPLPSFFSTPGGENKRKSGLRGTTGSDWFAALQSTHHLKTLETLETQSTTQTRPGLSLSKWLKLNN